ncbi:hypothetical protein CHL9767_09410 [Campylobacter hyointestinalis subsp. lawsonii]|nr:hypothetical protein CHL9767_09410 [Campylobacter hyointestinalis subsp. lawsonii]
MVKMPKISTANLYDKDIMGLLPKEKIYKKSSRQSKRAIHKSLPKWLENICYTIQKHKSF